LRGGSGVCSPERSMSDHSSPLFDLVHHTLTRERFAALHWTGTFQEYLELVEAHPLVARNAWQRLLDMIESHGFVRPERRGACRRWRVFDDVFGNGDDAVYGLDEPLAQLVQTVRAGAR